MGLFDKLFGKKQAPASPEDPNAIRGSVDSIAAFSGDIRRHLGEGLFAQDGLEKQVLSAYAFGGVNVLSQQRGLTPPQAHAIMLAVLIKAFGYSPEDSAANAQALITSTGDGRSSLNGIIHRGIDGFLAWQKNSSAFDASDFRDVLATLSKFKPQ